MRWQANQLPHKRAEIADWLTAENLDATVMTALDSIAWTFNLRGEDVSHTPVGLAFAIVHADATADLFVAPDKVPADVAQALGNGVRLHPREAFAPALEALKGKRVAADPGPCGLRCVRGPRSGRGAGRIPARSRGAGQGDQEPRRTGGAASRRRRATVRR